MGNTVAVGASRSEKGTVKGFVKDSLGYSVVGAGIGALVGLFAAPTILAGAAFGRGAGTVVAAAEHGLTKSFSTKKK